ncbi:ribose-5-phosphate isomerase RpiA [Sediminibacillus dalangtanensis]|uniref:Ribose-5-phosphate isomerase A n=1 Tax=Sediminibacillus dalangtanensis TaxID=2729421 RepID=A0ABX7VTL0_9BACI|nr:ribose-5-phosphate isomerase RpiA [Sediminibacillus dalangtanensis]QTN00283.1 ribose-5-phosphate isomerase RpiA [Sediminibacillus dalangtanensis]
MLYDVEEKKRRAGEKAVEYIEDGMTIGLGSGSTVYWMIKKLGERIKQGLEVKGVPSSLRTEAWAREFGIPLVYFSEVNRLDLAIDGADEVDPDFQLIKGGGGSLLREKLVADAAKKLIIIVDESKQVQKLGRFPLPVEIVRFGWESTARKLSSFGCNPMLRKTEDGEVFVTNNDNYIVDCVFDAITDPEGLHRELKLLLGVVETGLFLKRTDKVIVGRKRGVDILER